MLKEAGSDVALGGNIGVPVLDLPPPAEDRTHVIECSSYQIDLAPSLAPSVGLLINITPDHLDRHGDLAALRGDQGAAGRAVRRGAGRRRRRPLPRDLRPTEGAGRPAPASSPYPAQNRRSPTCSFAIGGSSAAARPRASVDLAGARALRGAHNGQNAAFAYAAARALGVAGETIAQAFLSFPGLAHRMEEVGRKGRVLFVNDSKATNADAAEKALQSFRDIHWILGGKPKEGGIEPLRPLFPRVAKAYLIGEAADAFARTLAGAVPFERCGTLAAATEAAARDALRSRRGRTRRAAVAGLRVVRPVRQFRGARRSVPRRRREAHAGGGIGMVSRAERGPVADWMRTVDRWLLGSFLALMVIGLVMALAASPAVAERLNLSTLPFRQPAGADARPDRDPDGRDLVPVAAPRAPRGAAPVHLLARR